MWVMEKKENLMMTLRILLKQLEEYYRDQKMRKKLGFGWEVGADR